MSNYLLNATARAATEVSVAVKTVSDFWRSFHQDNVKRKRDPYMPALRSKGEKAPNRRNRIK
jgi:SMC interacting uncharacterized protein involved in chromosome segregation